MRAIFTTLILMVLVGPAKAPAEKLPTIHALRAPYVYSEGYVMGRAVDPSLMGIVKKFFESQILMGYESVPAGLTNRRCYEHTFEELERESGPFARRPNLEEKARSECSERINPFIVNSYVTDWFDVFRKIADRMSLFRFRSYIFYPWMDSPHMIKGIWPVKNKKSLAPSMDESPKWWIYPHLNYGISQDDGHVVIASEDGIFRRRFRIIVQRGEGGGLFAELEVPTRKLFEYILECMLTGRSVRVYYYTLFDIEALPSDIAFGYRTPTRVYRVDLLDE